MTYWEIFSLFSWVNIADRQNEPLKKVGPNLASLKHIISVKKSPGFSLYEAN